VEQGVTPATRARTKHGDETRERILDVAERLFVQQGYDKTSLREIASEMGFSKAALYYHFASKEDILLALHLRLHAVGVDAVTRHLSGAPDSLAAWSSLLQEVAGDLIAHRDLLLLHQQNRSAMAALAARHEHDDSHRDFETEIQAAMSNPALRIEDRVRLGAAMGAVFFGVFTPGNSFDDIPEDVLLSGILTVVRDLLGPGVAPTS
jgi:AcrR family transcriptional regulator